jgi:dienelactone hydrolase
MKIQRLLLCLCAATFLGGCTSSGTFAPLATNTPVPLTPTATNAATQTPAPPTATLPIPSVTATPEALPLSYAEALTQYPYDPSAPFDLQVVSTQTKEGITIQDISYAAADAQFTALSRGRIETYIVSPAGQGPFAGVLYVHGLGQGWGNREEFLDESVELAHQGVVSVLPAGLVPWTVSHTGTARGDQDNVIKQVIELRRALDLLLAQPGVDPQRIAYVGHDYGAMHGAVLAAVDKRARAYVLMAGDATYSHWAIQYFTSPADHPAYQQAMSAVDPISYLPEAKPAALYFQFGKDDSFIPQETAQKEYEAASQPKKADWYDAGHTLNDQSVKDRLTWLAAQLDLKANASQ